MDYSLIADIFESSWLIQQYRKRNHPACNAAKDEPWRMKPLPPLLSPYKNGTVPEITTSNWNGVKLKAIMKGRQLADRAGHPHINRFPNDDHYGLLLERRFQKPGMAKWDPNNWPLICAATLSLRNMQCSRCCCKRDQKISAVTKTNMMFVRENYEQMCNDWFIQMAAAFSAATGFARTFTAVVNMHQCNGYTKAARECEEAGVVAFSNFLWKEKYGLQCGICKGKWRDLADDPYERVSRVCTDEQGNDMWERTHVCNMRKTHVVDGKNKHCYDCRVANPDAHCNDYAAKSIWLNDASHRDVTPEQQKQPVDMKTFGAGPEKAQWERNNFPKGLLRIKGRPGLYSKELVSNVLDSEFRSIVSPNKVV